MKSITVPALWKKSQIWRNELIYPRKHSGETVSILWCDSKPMVFSKHKWNFSLQSKKRGPWHPSPWGESPEALVSKGGEAGLALLSPAYANLNWQVRLLLKRLWCWENIMDLEWEQGTDAPMFRTEVRCLYWQRNSCFSPLARAETGLGKAAELVKLVTLYWVQWSEVKWSCSVVSDSLWPHGLKPSRLLHPWDVPAMSIGVGCHCPLWNNS